MACCSHSRRPAQLALKLAAMSLTDCPFGRRFVAGGGEPRGGVSFFWCGLVELVGVGWGWLVWCAPLHFLALAARELSLLSWENGRPQQVESFTSRGRIILPQANRPLGAIGVPGKWNDQNKAIPCLEVSVKGKSKANHAHPVASFPAYRTSKFRGLSLFNSWARLIPKIIIHRRVRAT